ncbi:MAG TPA: glycosyltransferase [Plantibacter sp.]|uniref:glycosyltransferase family 2 protein n=1 Tax=unclassified Plantibacter TaxID=2624265 RepID=UPI002BC72250|nr:glycosyltransferase [Plantibacter sp.]
MWLGEDDAPEIDAEAVLRIPPGRHGLRLAAARNAGAAAALAAGAELLVFLDADCVPGPSMLSRYREAAARHPAAVLCGPVTYLDAGVDTTDADTLAARTAPHPARPNPSEGSERVATADEYSLFWSLSFALTAETWRHAPRFDEGFEGYGGEDTDFAWSLRVVQVPLAWVGGAHAYHQYHETQSPPWQHLDDILRNGAHFAAKWGQWPMTGWLEAFAEAGAVSWNGSTWFATGEAASSYATESCRPLGGSPAKRDQ